MAKKVKIKIMWSKRSYRILGKNSKRVVSKAVAQRYFKRYSALKKYYSRTYKAKIYHLG